MIEGRARPEHPEFLFDAFPCDPVIIRDSAVRGATQFVIDVTRGSRIGNIDRVQVFAPDRI